MASALDVDTDLLVLTNGASEAIALVAALHPVGDVVDPEFSQYRRHLAEVRPGAMRWRSNPSAPRGRLAAPDDTAAVWDESYYALATGRWTRGDATSWRIASLTKVWRCAGLRLGYVIAPTPADADAVRRLQPEWSVNGLALAVVEELAGTSDLERWATQIAESRRTLVRELFDRGLAAIDTEANWILIDDAGWLVEPLFRERILVRELGNYALPGKVRIAAPDDATLDRLLTAIDRALNAR